MDWEISRRSFLKKSAIALGTVAVFDFTSIGSAEQVSGLYHASILASTPKRPRAPFKSKDLNRSKETE